MTEREEIKQFRAQLDSIIVWLRSGRKLAYSLDEASEATTIGRTSLYEDIAAGKLEARKRGRSTIILTDDLLTYLDALPAWTGWSPPRHRIKGGRHERA